MRGIRRQACIISRRRGLSGDAAGLLFDWLRLWGSGRGGLILRSSGRGRVTQNQPPLPAQNSRESRGGAQRGRRCEGGEWGAFEVPVAGAESRKISPHSPPRIRGSQGKETSGVTAVRAGSRAGDCLFPQSGICDKIRGIQSYDMICRGEDA